MMCMDPCQIRSMVYHFKIGAVLFDQLKETHNYSYTLNEILC